MKVQLIKAWEEVRSSYWFVPGLMAIGAVLLSFLMIWLDQQTQYDFRERIGFVWGGGPDGARQLLATVAGSMITVAGVTFSITIVALSQASSQFGPRLLRNFMRDTGNQVVLGTFIATFTYSLLILRTVRGGNGDEFVPHVAVTFTLVLAIASIGVLIYFIHHASLSIQAPVVIADVAQDMFDTIERLFPAELGESTPEEREPEYTLADLEQLEAEARPIPATNTGYLQVIDSDELMRLAAVHDLLLIVKFRPGHFVLEEKALVMALPQTNASDEVCDQIRNTFALGHQRSHTQDVEFAINQLVEVAVRSLSAGINDPFTAISCIDWLGAGLAKLAETAFPTQHRHDAAGKLRIFLEHPETFVGALDAAFDQIRQHAGRNVAVRMRLLEALTQVAEHVHNEEDRRALLHHAEMVRQESYDEIEEPSDLEDIEERYQAMLEKNN
jgi:uncharacterized membrane protein